MTLATEIRTRVLAYADLGLLEDEIAKQVGIPTARVLQVLDTVEASPVRLSEEWTPPKPRQRNYAGTNLSTPAKPRKRLPYRRDPDARPYTREFVHGTESAYQKHKRLGEPPCRECRDAANRAASERRARTGGKKEQLARRASAQRYHDWIMGTIPATRERKSSNLVIRQTRIPLPPGPRSRKQG